MPRFPSRLLWIIGGLAAVAALSIAGLVGWATWWLLFKDGDDRFNRYGYLKAEPASLEAVATYRLTPSSGAYPALMEMGYVPIDSTIRIEANQTFTGTRVPDCCLTGDDSRMNRPVVAGGLYDIEGTWRLVKGDYIHHLEFKFTRITKVAPGLATDPVMPETREVSLVIGTPFTIGFNVHDGDFRPVAYDRVP